MYNNKACDTCEYFDPVLKGKHGKTVETIWGWCAKKSLYPTKEGQGQIFPPGVKRANEGEMPKPVIIRKGQVVSNCTLYQVRKTKPSKKDLVAKLHKV